MCLDFNDNNCEIDPIEDFFSDLAYVSGEQPINIDPTRARHVIINDNAEPECGRYIIVTTVPEPHISFICMSL